MIDIVVFKEMIERNHKKNNQQEVTKPASSNVDDIIVFKQLRDKSSLGIMIDIDDNTAIQQATGIIAFIHALMG